jgi:DNA primase catalytic core
MTESDHEPSRKRAVYDGAQDEALFHAGRQRECSPAPDLDELDTERALVEANRWDQAPVQRARLLELNELAAGFFTAGYANSWGPQYVNSRLGTDLADHGGFRPGYAPAGWTTLTEHLRHLGAGDQEILAAGLGRVASTGAIIDLFRERLVLPIRNGREIHGFIGRRQPAPADRGKAGPKYLNTPATDLFDKSAQLFGLSEGRAALDAGATPVLVEGFFDAIAVTLAAGGRHVGLAPLGTSLTASQANQLRPYVGARRPGVTVATDADLAGEIAAQRAFWMLAARGHAPRHVLLPHGQDPAEVLARGGPMALRACLQDAHPLARHLLDERRNHLGEGPQLLAECAAIIAAAPPHTWVEQIDYAGAGTNFGPGALRAAVAGAARRWTLDPLGSAQAQIGDLWLVRTRLQRAGEIPLPADGPSELIWGADLAAKPLPHRTQSGQPDLGSGGDQLGTDPGRVPGQPAPFPYLVVFTKDAVHRGNRAQVRVLVQELGVDLQRWLVHEPRRVQRGHHPCPLGDAEPVRGHHPGRAQRCGRFPACCCPGQAGQLRGRPGRDPCRPQVLVGGHQRLLGLG